MTDTAPPRFHEFLRTYRNGALDDKLTAAIAEVAQAVILLEKKGTVTVTLTLSEKAGGVVVEASMKSTVPTNKETGQFFYVTPDGALTRRDPSQPQLPTLEDKDA